MTKYFTKAFFDELAERLNADPEWSKKAASTAAKIVLTCADRNASFLIDVRNGKVVAMESTPDIPADFKFEGNYDAWTQLGKGEKSAFCELLERYPLIPESYHLTKRTYCVNNSMEQTTTLVARPLRGSQPSVANLSCLLSQLN